MPLQSIFLASRAGPAALLLAALASALALQHTLGWAPCPLCIIQRITALALLVALMGYATTSNETWQDVWLAVGGLATGFALLAAGAHLYLIFSPQEATCGPGLAMAVTRLVEALPGSEWLLEGSGACGDTRYSIFGIPLPAWSGLAHVTAFGLALSQRLRQ